MDFFQVTFSDQAIAEINKLSPAEQMNIMEKLSSVSPEDINKPSDKLGSFIRDNIHYYRLRVGDSRMYFEINENQIFCHYLLAQHSLTDFIFRFKLPVSEEQMVEQHSSFWKYLESLKK